MINRSIIIGRLSKDPIVKSTQNTVIANFTVAVNKIKRQGEEQRADFISCVTFGKAAEYMEKYLKKGYLIGVDGKFQTSTYEKNGSTVYVTQIVCDSVQNYEPRHTSQEHQSNEPENQPPIDINSDDLPF